MTPLWYDINIKYEQQQIEPLNKKLKDLLCCCEPSWEKVILTIKIMMIEMYFDCYLIFFGDLSPPL